MIKGIRPPEKVLTLARKLKVPTTSLIWGTGAREYLKTSFIETLIRSRLKRRPNPRKHKPIPIPLGYGSKRLQEKARIWEKEEFKRLKKKFGKNY